MALEAHPHNLNLGRPFKGSPLPQQLQINSSLVPLVDLRAPPPPLIGRERILELETGRVSYIREEMSRRLNLKLNLSPQAHVAGPSRGAAEGSLNGRMSTSSSSPNSCVSSETDHGFDSPEATSMVLAACPRCIMYVMLAETDPRCPKCHNTVIVDFLRNENTTKKTKKSPNK